MKIIKRDGTPQSVSLDKITTRVRKMAKGLKVEPVKISQIVVGVLYDGISTKEIDEAIVSECSSRITDHPDYGTVASNILISRLEKETSGFRPTTELLNNRGLLDPDYYAFVSKHYDEIEAMIDYERDYNKEYFSSATMLNTYLLKVDGEVVERPQDMYARTAIAVAKESGSMSDVKELYDSMSMGLYTHATPTLFNSGLKLQQLSSCFLLGMEDDSIDGIFNTFGDIAKISKVAGGIGVHISNIRSKNSPIGNGVGTSDGVVPMLKVLNNIGRYVNQSGKRNGSIAVYMEPHHPDVMDFLELKKPTGSEDLRTRDLFLALWVSDLFMERVRDFKDWSFFDPHECPGLQDVYGDEYKALYEKYESEGKATATIPAKKVFEKILDSQAESGVPYITFKDTVNKHSNQKNIGVVKSSNLCVTGDTKITVKDLDGQVKEINIADLGDFDWKGYKVLSHNIETKVNEFKEILDFGMTAKDSHIESVSEYENPDKFVKCTTQHKFYTNHGYLEAKAIPLWFDGWTGVSKIAKNDPTLDQLPVGVGSKGESIKLVRRMIDVSENDRADVADVYDITVADNENFFANDILVHNCNEIVQVSGQVEQDDGTTALEQAVCNLASISLPAFVKGGKIDYKELFEVSKIATKNLNRVIDINYYPTEATRRSNMRHRPVGLGIQGLADVYFKLSVPFESAEASEINKNIMAVIYYGALTASNEIAKEQGHSYSTFKGSPFSKGIFQFDSYGVEPITKVSDDFTMDWDTLRQNVIEYGMANSLLTALMPTASTGILMGNIGACFEAQNSNIFKRKTLSGEFININKYLVWDLEKLGLWDSAMMNKIMSENGSVQNIQEIPENLREVYKTVWEISQKNVVNMSTDRQKYIDQTQSLNIFLDTPEFSKMGACLFHNWKNGGKTGQYYLRTKPSTSNVKMTTTTTNAPKVIDEPEECLTCSA